MSIDASGSYSGFSYKQNGLYGVASNVPVTDNNGKTYYSNAGINWEDIAVAGDNYNIDYTGSNPAPLTCGSNSNCPGIFNINNVNNNPSTNTTNDRVNYLASDAAKTGTISQASTLESFGNFSVYRFPYVAVEGSTNNMYCFEPKGPNGTGCDDGFICAQMDGIVPSDYQQQYFINNQQSNTGYFQGPSTNICYGGNFNLVNTNYENNKKDPIQPNTNARTPLYPERGVTLYQNPGCNRENNPDTKNGKYIGGTIKYEGKGVEIFGNCDVCFYVSPFRYVGLDSNGNLNGNVYPSMEYALQQKNTNDAYICIDKPTNTAGFSSTESYYSIFTGFTDQGFPTSASAQAKAAIPYPTPNLFQCITVVRNDGVLSAIEYIDPKIQNELNKYGNLTFDKIISLNNTLEDCIVTESGGIIYQDDAYKSQTNYNYGKYCGDYGLRFLPNELHDGTTDNLGINDITKNKLIKGIFLDPTITYDQALDLDHKSSRPYMYQSQLCPIPCAPNSTSKINYMNELPNTMPINLVTPDNFFLTTSSVYDGFSSIYIPPHMEVISVHYYESNNIVRFKRFTTPIRYEDSPFGDGCFPSFHPDDKFGIYGNSLVAISVRVRKDSAFLTKYVNNPSYNATAKSLEPAAPSNFGTVSTFRPEVLLIDPRPSAKTGTIPNITKGEYYQPKSDFPIEDAFGGYITLRTPYKNLLNGVSKKPGWFDKVKSAIGKNKPGLEMLYKSVFKINMNPNINVFSLEWLYVLYYCAMTNIVSGSGGCQATYVNEPSGKATGLLADGYINKCNIGNMSCLLFNKPYGCNTCNLTGNNMVLASGTTNTCADSTFATGSIGPSSADLFMSTYAANMSNKIFPFYFSLYQAGNVDCACIANIGQCPWNNWLPCSQQSSQYKLSGKTGAYLLCAEKNASSTRDCTASLINCNNYIYQYGEGAYNSNQNANLTGSCITVNKGGDTGGDTGNGGGGGDDTPTPPSNNMYIWIVFVILLIVVVCVFVGVGVYFYKKKARNTKGDIN